MTPVAHGGLGTHLVELLPAVALAVGIAAVWWRGRRQETPPSDAARARDEPGVEQRRG